MLLFDQIVFQEYFSVNTFALPAEKYCMSRPHTNSFTIKRIFDPETLDVLLSTREIVYKDLDKIPPPVEDDICSLNEIDYQIFAIYYNDEIIGGFNLNISSKLKWIPQSFSSQLPQIKSGIEIGKFFILKNKRSFYFLMKVFTFIHAQTRAHNKKYLICASDKRLLKLYQSLHFKETQLTFVKQQISSSSELKVLIATHRHLKIYGLLNGPFLWCLYMKPVIDEMRLNGMKLSLIEQLLYQVYKNFNFLTQKRIKRFTR